MFEVLVSALAVVQDVLIILPLVAVIVMHVYSGMENVKKKGNIL